MDKISKILTGEQPPQLRRELQESDSKNMRRRRRIIALSIVGIGVTGLISLFQTGMVKHLPDPPVEGFDADKVTTSDQAFLLGGADAPFAVFSFALNLPLAAFGGEHRAAQTPLVPLAAAGKSAIDAAASVWYVSQMPTSVKAWCLYCLVTAAAFGGVFALTLPEAKTALANLSESRR